MKDANGFKFLTTSESFTWGSHRKFSPKSDSTARLNNGLRQILNFRLNVKCPRVLMMSSNSRFKSYLTCNTPGPSLRHVLRISPSFRSPEVLRMELRRHRHPLPLERKPSTLVCCQRYGD